MRLIPNSGIYAWTSLSGGQYVGSAVDVYKRRNSHRVALRKGIHSNRIFQNAWKKYGEEGFTFEILLFCSKNDLLFYEQRAIDILKPRYNLSPSAGNSLGVKWTIESKLRKSEQVTGTRHTDETKKKMSEAHLGHPVSDETKVKLAAQRGWKHSEKTKAKMRGRIRTNKHKAALSASHLGKPGPLNGIPRSEEIKRKISIANTGRKLSDITRARMSAERKTRPTKSIVVICHSCGCEYKVSPCRLKKTLYCSIICLGKSKRKPPEVEEN